MPQRQTGSGSPPGVGHAPFWHSRDPRQLANRFARIADVFPSPFSLLSSFLNLTFWGALESNLQVTFRISGGQGGWMLWLNWPQTGKALKSGPFDCTTMPHNIQASQPVLYELLTQRYVCAHINTRRIVTLDGYF